MPTRKQRRREAKLRRHEWEEVYLDAEGNEVPIEEVEPEKERPAKAKDAAPAKTSKNGKPGRDARGRPIRIVPPPSWHRAVRRGAILAPIMFVVLILITNRGSRVYSIVLAFVYSAMLIPFIYLTDRMAYRTYLRRVGKAPPAPPRKRGRSS